MPKEWLKKNVIGPALAGVLTVSLIAFILWLTGLLKIIWLAVWGGIQYKLDTPIWVFALLVVFPVLASRLVFKGGIENTSSQNDKDETDLSDSKSSILRILAEADGDVVPENELRDKLNFSNLMIQDAIFTLSEKGAIYSERDLDLGTVYSLTPWGINVAIELGIIKS